VTGNLPDSHGADCACTRCKGFELGNAVALKHGAYVSVSRLQPLVAVRMAELVPLMPWLAPSDQETLHDYVIVEMRELFARRAIERVEQESQDNPLDSYVGAAGAQIDSLRRDHRAWLKLKRALRNDLGMNPLARSSMKLNAALSEDAAMRALERHLAQGEKV
jgi:hypothetical protein